MGSQFAEQPVLRPRDRFSARLVGTVDDRRDQSSQRRDQRTELLPFAGRHEPPGTPTVARGVEHGEFEQHDLDPKLKLSAVEGHRGGAERAREPLELEPEPAEQIDVTALKPRSHEGTLPTPRDNDVSVAAGARRAGWRGPGSRG